MTNIFEDNNDWAIFIFCQSHKNEISGLNGVIGMDDQPFRQEDGLLII